MKNIQIHESMDLALFTLATFVLVAWMVHATCPAIYALYMEVTLHNYIVFLGAVIVNVLFIGMAINLGKKLGK